MYSIITFLLSLVLATAAHAGPATAVVKIAEKAAAHGADNVAEKVIVHNADDAAKLAAKGAGKKATHVAPAVERAVVRSVEAVQAETRVAKPAVEVAARTPLVRPGTVAAGGVAAGTVVAAHNLTAGELEKDRALADATRKTLAERPDMLPGVLRADGETGFWNRVGEGAKRGVVVLSAVVGGLLALLALPGLVRRFRTPCAKDGGSEPVEFPNRKAA